MGRWLTTASFLFIRSCKPKKERAERVYAVFLLRVINIRCRDASSQFVNIWYLISRPFTLSLHDLRALCDAAADHSTKKLSRGRMQRLTRFLQLLTETSTESSCDFWEKSCDRISNDSPLSRNKVGCNYQKNGNGSVLWNHVVFPGVFLSVDRMESMGFPCSRHMLNCHRAACAWSYSHSMRSRKYPTTEIRK